MYIDKFSLFEAEAIIKESSVSSLIQDIDRCYNNYPSLSAMETGDITFLEEKREYPKFSQEVKLEHTITKNCKIYFKVQRESEQYEILFYFKVSFRGIENYDMPEPGMNDNEQRLGVSLESLKTEKIQVKSPSLQFNSSSFGNSLDEIAMKFILALLKPEFDRVNDQTMNESFQELTFIQTKYLNEISKSKWKQTDKGLINVNGDVILKKGFMGLKFGKVTGQFSCNSNNLSSLEGSPHTVGGDFLCYDNNLTSLEGSPHTVKGGFYCALNNLTTLEGVPQLIGDSFDCTKNNLSTLKGSPLAVGRHFDCDMNNLTTLEGCPQTVGSDFVCSNNKLTSLVGCPQTVLNFYCSNNNLTNLEGYPQTVERDFNCSNNSLTSLKGLHTPGGDFSYSYNVVSDDVFDKLYVEMKKRYTWELALAIHKKDIPEDEWGKITDKPSDAELEKLLHDNRGKIHTEKFGI